MAGIFKAYDVRGVYPTELNEGMAFKIGRSFGKLNPGKIVVGCDVRLSSPSLKRELIKGLLAAGCDVIDVGMVTTPMVLFATVFYRFDGGVSVTASHNPKEYNGFRFNDNRGIPLSYESGISRIEKLCDKVSAAKGGGTVYTKNIADDYVKFLASKVKPKTSAGFKVVVDAGNGPAGPVFPKIMRLAGMRVVELFCEPDGNFPNHHPDPSKKENLVDLQKKVLEEKADVGLATDGDGDRLGVVDEKGNVVEPRKVFAILIKELLRKNPDAKVIYDALASKMIDDTIVQLGGVPIICRVGNTYIAQKMVSENASLAGELSGHYYFKDIFVADDAMFAALKFMEALSHAGETLSSYVKEFPDYFSGDARVPVKESEKLKFIDGLKKEFEKKGFKVDTLDGVKVILDNSWALFRPSNTEPKISIAYESTDKKGFEEIKRLVDSIIERIPK